MMIRHALASSGPGFQVASARGRNAEISPPPMASREIHRPLLSIWLESSRGMMCLLNLDGQSLAAASHRATCSAFLKNLIAILSSYPLRDLRIIAIGISLE